MNSYLQINKKNIGTDGVQPLLFSLETGLEVDKTLVQE